MMSDLESCGLKSSPFFISTLSSTSVPENGDISFFCMLSGSPKPEVTWYWNGQNVNEQKKILNYEMLEDKLTHILHIFRCTEQQAGVYQIVAKNCFGTIKSSAFLKVLSGAKPEVDEKLVCIHKDDIETRRANEDAEHQWRNSSAVMEDKEDLTEEKDSTDGFFCSASEFDDFSTEQTFATKVFDHKKCRICLPEENEYQNAHCLGDNMEVKNVPSPEENGDSVSSISKNCFILGSIEESRDSIGGEGGEEVDSKPANQITDHTDSCCFHAEVLVACQTTEYAKTHEESSFSQFLEKGTLYGSHSSESLESQTCFINDSCKNVDSNFEHHLDRNFITCDELFEDDRLELLECSSVTREEQNWEEKLRFLLESDDEDELNLASDCDGCAYFLGEIPYSVQVSDNTVPMDTTIGFCDHQSKSREVAVRSDLIASISQAGMTLMVGQQQTKTSTVKDKEKYTLPVTSTAIENDCSRIEENISNNNSAVDFPVVRSQGTESKNLEMNSSSCSLGDSSATTGKQSVDGGFLRKNSLPLTKTREKLSKGKVKVGVASWTKECKNYSCLLHPRTLPTSAIPAIQTESSLDSTELLQDQEGSISSEAHKDTVNASNKQSGLFTEKGRDKNSPREGKWISDQSKGKQMPDENTMLMVEKQETDIDNTIPINDEPHFFITEPELDKRFIFTSSADRVSWAENPALENVSGRNGFQMDNAVLENLCYALKGTRDSDMQEPRSTQTFPVITIDTPENCNAPDAVGHTDATSKQKGLCDIMTSMTLPGKEMEDIETNGEKPHESKESNAVCDTPCMGYLSKVDFQTALESSEADLSSVHEQLQKLLDEEDDWSYDFTPQSSEVKSLAAGTDVSAGQHARGNLTEDNQPVTELATVRKDHTDFNSLLKTDEACSNAAMGESCLTLPVESDAMCLCSAFENEKEKPSVHLLSSEHVNAQMYFENQHNETQPDHNRSIQMSTSQEGIVMTDNAWQSCGAAFSFKLPEATSSALELGEEMLSDVPANYLGQLSYTEQDVHGTDGSIAKQTFKLPTKESNVTICHSSIKERANLVELSLKEDSSSNLTDKNTDQFASEAISKCTEERFQKKGTETEMKALNDNNCSTDNVLRGNNSKELQGVCYAVNSGCYMQEHNLVTDTSHKVDHTELDFTGQDSKIIQEGIEEPVFTASYKVKLFTELLLEKKKNDGHDRRQARKVLGATAGQTDSESKHEQKMPLLDFQQKEKQSRMMCHPGEFVKSLGMDSACIISQSGKSAALNTIPDSGIRNITSQNTRNMAGTVTISTQDKHKQENMDKVCSTNGLVTGFSSTKSLVQTESMLNADKEKKDAQTPERLQDQYQKVEEKSKAQIAQYERERQMNMLRDLEATEMEPCMWYVTDSEEQINTCDSTAPQKRYQKVEEKTQTKITPCEGDARETLMTLVCYLEEAEVEPYMRALINSEEMYSWHNSTDYVHPSMISSNEQTSEGGNAVTCTGHRSAGECTACGSKNVGPSEHAIGTLVSISPCASENSHLSQEQLPQDKTQPRILAATAEDPGALKEEQAKLQEASKFYKSPSPHSSLEDMKQKQVTVKKKMISKGQVKKPRLEAKENINNNALCVKKVSSKAEAGSDHKEDDREQRKLPCKKDNRAPKLLKDIQAEPFPDFSGNIKLCCQFGEIHEDSIITWTKDSKLLARVQRSAGDDFPVSLAIVQAGKKDQGLYYCCLKNGCGKASAEFHLTSEVLEHLSSFQDVEGLEEIEFLQLMFREDFINDSYFSNSLHGRITTEALHFGEGVHRKAFRSKVMQGLVPVFSPGHPFVLKVHNAIAYGTKNNDELLKKNYKLALQECYVQNTAREYAKIYAAETKILEGFGDVPEIIPIFLIHRPKNNIPYATVEEELIGEFVKYSVKDGKEINFLRRDSEAGQKCCTFQHWVYEKTSGNLLVTDMQGVGMKLTDVGIATLAKGYKGFKGNCSTSFIEQFKALHQCNKYCEMLGLVPLQINCQKQRKPAATKTKAQPSISTGKKTVINTQTAKKK